MIKIKDLFLTIVYTVCIFIITIYILLDTFILTKSYIVVSNNSVNSNKKVSTTTVEKDDNKYIDDNIEITIKEYRENNTTIYVADVKVKNSEYLKTAFANNTYGKNIVAKTSTIANSVNAILAVNGDYYGVQQAGYVLKNGTAYRNTSKGNEDLVIYSDGSFKIINEDDITLEQLVKEGAYNILSFGPAIVENKEISVSKNEEVGKAMASNPRTAIGLISDNHYVFVVSDGRTDESTGLSLYQLAEFMKEIGCSTAYNLDGGGSSTMYFNGKVINKPTTTGKISERSVSDIVYIGY